MNLVKNFVNLLSFVHLLINFFFTEQNTLPENSKAVLEEDLFKVIDLAKPLKRKSKCLFKDSEEPSVLAQFDNNLCLEDKSSDCVSEESSMFKEINEKFELVKNSKSDDNENYISLNDSDLEMMVKKKLGSEESEDIWSEHSKTVLNYSTTKGNCLSVTYTPLFAFFTVITNLVYGLT